MKKLFIALVVLVLFVIRFAIPLQDVYHETEEEWKQSHSQAKEKTYLSATSAEEVLTAINYYGNPEGCQMTGEQARAYAELLHDRQFVYGAEEQPGVWILLGDFSGDGNPYLYVNPFHHERSKAGKWMTTVIDATEIYGWKDGTAHVIYEQTEGVPTLEKQSRLTNFVLLSDRQRPNATDWYGNYYDFRDGEIHQIYQWEKYFDFEEELWYFMEMGNTVTYTSEEYYALPSALRNDPISRGVVIADEVGPSDRSGTITSVVDMVEALNLYAEFVETK